MVREAYNACRSGLCATQLFLSKIGNFTASILIKIEVEIVEIGNLKRWQVLKDTNRLFFASYFLDHDRITFLLKT
jgi:hypothetical protein